MVLEDDGVFRTWLVDLAVFKQHGALRNRRQTGNEIGLAAARMANDRDELALANRQVDVFQDLGAHAAPIDSYRHHRQTWKHSMANAVPLGPASSPDPAATEPPRGTSCLEAGEHRQQESYEMILHAHFISVSVDLSRRRASPPIR